MQQIAASISEETLHPTDTRSFFRAKLLCFLRKFAMICCIKSWNPERGNVLIPVPQINFASAAKILLYLSSYARQRQYMLQTQEKHKMKERFAVSVLLVYVGLRQ